MHFSKKSAVAIFGGIIGVIAVVGIVVSLTSVEDDAKPQTDKIAFVVNVPYVSTTLTRVEVLNNKDAYEAAYLDALQVANVVNTDGRTRVVLSNVAEVDDIDNIPTDLVVPEGIVLPASTAATTLATPGLVCVFSFTTVTTNTSLLPQYMTNFEQETLDALESPAFRTAFNSAGGPTLSSLGSVSDTLFHVTYDMTEVVTPTPTPSSTSSSSNTATVTATESSSASSTITSTETSSSSATVTSTSTHSETSTKSPTSSVSSSSSVSETATNSATSSVTATSSSSVSETASSSVTMTSSSTQTATSTNSPTSSATSSSSASETATNSATSSVTASSSSSSSETASSSVTMTSTSTQTATNSRTASATETSTETATTSSSSSASVTSTPSSSVTTTSTQSPTATVSATASVSPAGGPVAAPDNCVGRRRFISNHIGGCPALNTEETCHQNFDNLGNVCTWIEGTCTTGANCVTDLQDADNAVCADNTDVGNCGTATDEVSCIQSKDGTNLCMWKDSTTCILTIAACH